MNKFDVLKAPELSLKDIGDLINNSEDFIIYGETGLVAKVKRVLNKINKRVVRSVDLGKGKDLFERGVYGAGKIDLKGAKVIIASYHELEIAKRLAAKYNLAYYRDYVFFDQVKMVVDKNYLDAFGRDFYVFFKKEEDKFEKVMNILGDNYSKEMYKKIINFRINFFNPEEINLEQIPTPPEVQREYESGADRYVSMVSSSIPEQLRRDIAFKISLDQYSYFDIVTARGKKIIFNVGAYNNTSVMFACFSPGGVVYAFEPQVRMHQCNVELAKTYSNIVPINAGAWNKTGKVPFEIRESDIGGSTASRIDSKGYGEINVYRIDDFVASNNIERVDFVKMDVEGVEIEALEGARTTIRKHQPDLAISIYHKPEHLYSIPLLIKEMYPGYKIYISHKYYNPTETVCFATAEQTSRAYLK